MRTRVEITETPALSPNVKVGRHRHRIVVDHQGERLETAWVTRRKRHAHRHGNDGGVLGARRHLDAHEPGAVGERASLEDVVGERRPAILRRGSCGEGEPSRSNLQRCRKARDTKPGPMEACRSEACRSEACRTKPPQSDHGSLLRSGRGNSTPQYSARRDNSIPIRAPNRPPWRCGRCSRRTAPTASAPIPRRSATRRRWCRRA